MAPVGAPSALCSVFRRALLLVAVHPGGVRLASKGGATADILEPSLRATIAVMVEPEAMRSRVPQEFHEGSVLSASGQAWQGNERGWQIRAGGSSQVDVIDVQARR